jgi:hypothetical protein
MFQLAKLPIACTLLIASALVGCASGAEEESPSSGAGDVDRTKGLTLDEAAPDHVTGAFARDGATIGFDLATDGHTRHAVLTLGSGAPLLDATMVDGIESAKLLGGRLVVTGDATSVEPKLEGDRHVIEELAALPESQLVIPMKEALGAAHVDAALFNVQPAPSSSELQPLDLVTWTRLDARQSISVPTWSFWGVTRIRLYNETTGSQTASLTTFNGVRGFVTLATAYEMREVSGQWWGMPVTVRNETYWIGLGIWVRAY